MAILRTGPFMVPNITCSGNPITHLFVTLTNLSRRTLTARVQAHRGFIPAIHPTDPIVPAPIFQLFPPNPIRLTPLSGVMFASFIGSTTTSATLKRDPQVIVVTVDGDVDLSRDLIEVSVTAGFSSDGGRTLNEAEPTMFFRNQDFLAVSGGHLPCGNDDDESCS